MSKLLLDNYNGIIELDTPFAEKIGFTSDKFYSSWLWRLEDYIWISMIHSKYEKKGNVKNLLDNIKKIGFKIKVPVPFERMKKIVKKAGFKQTYELIKTINGMEEIEVWIYEKE